MYERVFVLYLFVAWAQAIKSNIISINERVINTTGGNYIERARPYELGERLILVGSVLHSKIGYSNLLTE